MPVGWVWCLTHHCLVCRCFVRRQCSATWWRHVEVILRDTEQHLLMLVTLCICNHSFSLIVASCSVDNSTLLFTCNNREDVGSKDSYLTDAQCLFLLLQLYSSATKWVVHLCKDSCAASTSPNHFCGTGLSWLQSCITDRIQHVGIGTEQYVPVNWMSGLPQGSMLGPLLFAMYMSQLSLVGNVVSAHNLHRHQYTDNTLLYMYMAIWASVKVTTRTGILECVVDISCWLLVGRKQAASQLYNDWSSPVRRQSSAWEDVNSGWSERHRGTVVPFHDTVKLLGVTLDSGPAHHWSSAQRPLQHSCTASHLPCADTRHCHQDDHTQCCMIAAGLRQCTMAQHVYNQHE